MAGAASELNEAILINPSDNIEMADAINSALEMTPEENKQRLESMQKRISSYNVFTWAFDFFKQTSEIKEQQNKMNIRFINKGTSDQFISAYQKAKHRILFLDYDGTLVSFAKYPELATMDKNTLKIIRDLSDDSKNKIVIISGREKDFLEKQFNGVNITLIAEHGYFIKKAGENWETAIPYG